jgi:hypothetical protein
MREKDLKLYDIPEKSKIYEKVLDGSSYFIFDHLDGMYSYCISEKGAVIHLSASAPLRKYKDGFKFREK